MKTKPLSIPEFEGLFKEYFRPLTVFALQFVNVTEIAEDIVQGLFLYIYEKREELDKKTVTRSYLYKAVQNRCLNNLKHNRVKENNKSELVDNLNHFPDTPEDIVRQIELENKMLQALELLSPVCRKIFEMSRFEGISNHEIAIKQSISKRTVESHIHQALKIMKKKLKRFLIVL